MLNRLGYDVAWVIVCLHAIEVVRGVEFGAEFAIHCGALAVIAQLPEARLSNAVWLLVKLGVVAEGLTAARLRRWGAPGIDGVVICDGDVDRFVLMGDRAGVVCERTFGTEGEGLSLEQRLAEIQDLDPAWMLMPPIDRAKSALEVTP